MKKKLFEFVASLECGYIVAAETEEAAREAIETYEGAFYESGDVLGVSGVDLVDVRDADQECLGNLAHEIV